MKDNLFDQLHEDKKINELTFDTLNYVLDTIKNELEEEPDINNVIIFDDMTAYLRDNQVKKLLNQLVYNRRHWHTNVYFLGQTYNN